MRVAGGGVRKANVGPLHPELESLISGLYRLAHRLYAQGVTLDNFGIEEQAALMGVLGAVSRTGFTPDDLEAAIREIMGMEAMLVREFVTPHHKHQYTPDGRMHTSNPLALLLMMFWPNTEFRGDEVRALSPDDRIAPLRSWRAMFRLVAGAWFLGQRQRLEDRDLRIERVVAHLEEHLFATPAEENARWSEQNGLRCVAPELHVEVDAANGCAFRRLVGQPNKHTVTREMIPRYIQVRGTGGSITAVPVYMAARPKDPPSEFRKAVIGREQYDTIGVRIWVRNMEEWAQVRGPMHEELFQYGEPDRDFALVQSGQASTNTASVADQGVLWQGNVRLDGVLVEVQVLLFRTNWNRQHSLLPSTHETYKAVQWLLSVRWSAENPDPDPGNQLPPIIQLVYPTCLFPHWLDRETVLDSHQMRLLRLAAQEYGENPVLFARAVEWVQRSVQEARRREPLKL